MGSLLWPFIVILLWNMCHSWNLSNCSPRSASDLVPPIMEDINQNFTSNMSGVDFNMDLQSQNTSDYSIDDAHEANNIRRNYNGYREHAIMTRLQEIAIKVGSLRDPNMTNSTAPPIGDDQRQHLENILESFKNRTNLDDSYTAKIQNFYPSCSIPRNADKEAWEAEGLFNIFYEIHIPRDSHTSLKVTSAKLHLYKSEIPVVEAPATTAYSVHQYDNRESEADYIPACDERFRISVYQYIKPLKKTKRVKKIKKLIDSRMMAMDYVGWLEFDIKSTIRDWVEDKNYGLEIVVEDTVEKTYNPAYFFQSMNCSEGELNNLRANESILLETKPFPTLDLRTVEHDIDTTTIINAKRHKRQSSENCSLTDFQDQRGCCMVTAYVSFKELMWDKFIIEPEGFYTGICLGSCSNTRIATSCKPGEMSPLSVLYLNRNSTHVTRLTIPNVITTSCYCGSD